MLKKNFILLFFCFLTLNAQKQHIEESLLPKTISVQGEGFSCYTAIQDALLKALSQIETQQEKEIPEFIYQYLQLQFIQNFTEEDLRQNLSTITHHLLKNFKITKIQEENQKIVINLLITLGQYDPTNNKLSQANLFLLPFSINKTNILANHILLNFSAEDFCLQIENSLTNILQEKNKNFIFSFSQITPVVIPQLKKLPLTRQQIIELKNIGNKNQIQYWLSGEISQINYKENISFDNSLKKFNTKRILSITCSFQLLKNSTTNSQLSLHQFTFVFPSEKLNALIIKQQFSLIEPIFIQQAAIFFAEKLAPFLP